MKALSMVLGLAAVFTLAVAVHAEKAAKESGKEVTLTGKITCAKCDLMEEEYVNSKKCETVIQVKEDGKDVTYYFDTASHKANHKDICTTPKDGTVKGTVSEKGGKKWVHVDTIKYSE